MSNFLHLVLVKSAYQTIERRYQNYRQHGFSHVTAFISTLFIALAWLFLRLESSGWRWIRRNRRHWFPHLSPQHPRPGDFLRYLIQGLWLLLVIQSRPPKFGPRLKQSTQRGIKLYYAWVHSLPNKIENSHLGQKLSQNYKQISEKSYRLLLVFASICSTILLLICITAPFAPKAQFIFLIVIWLAAMSIRKIPGRLTVIMLVVLSLIVSFRYLWWRYTTTLYWPDAVSMIFGVLLIFAETYIFVVLVLGYFQSIWPLYRQPVALPKASSSWPTVDIMITTYNEDLGILKPGVYAALGIDWPKNKLNIYILDDGNRPSVKQFAEQVGVHYIARTSNEFAKAGNINHALQRTRGEFVCIFDCDHIPNHAFLQLTMGWFLKDPKLAIVQTPHHFFSPDPFERNLGSFKKIPNENALFYGVVQDGNDLWDATYFCGSAGILRRSALDEIGGFSVESVTEDTLTSIRLQRLGYTSAYIRIPMSAGLATESISGHIGQRIRWARGMVQILRIDNPLTGKGLTFPQRLCYFNAIMHFLSGIPRLIFLTTPVVFLVFHAKIIYAPAVMVVLYALPHIAHAVMANSCIQGKYRHFLWNEIYETVMAWYIAVPTTIALINPRKGKFNVTAKGGLIKERYADWVTARPYLILLVINSIGLLTGLWRLPFGATDEIMPVLITLMWVVYNIAIIGGALGVVIEAKQESISHRVSFAMSAAIAREDGHLFPCTLRNYSDSGVGIELSAPTLLSNGENVFLLLKHGLEEFQFPCTVRRLFDCQAGLSLSELSVKQHIDFMRCTFTRADTWALWQTNMPEDKPMESMRNVLKLDFRGYLRIIEYTPPLVRGVLTGVIRMMIWGTSFAPHHIKARVPD